MVTRSRPEREPEFQAWLTSPERHGFALAIERGSWSRDGAVDTKPPFESPSYQAAVCVADLLHFPELVALTYVTPFHFPPSSFIPRAERLADSYGTIVAQKGIPEPFFDLIPRPSVPRARFYRIHEYELRENFAGVSLHREWSFAAYYPDPGYGYAHWTDFFPVLVPLPDGHSAWSIFERAKSRDTR